VVEVSVPQATEQSVIKLPVTAIRRDIFGSFVFTLNKDSNNAFRAERKQVELIHRTDTTAMISVQLGEGLTVATTGSYKLKPGILTYTNAQ